MLVAASGKAATRLTKAFADGRVEKRYLAVVDGVPERPSAVLVDAMRSPAGGAAKPTACRSLAVLDEEPSDWSGFEVPTGYKLAATSYDVVAQADGKTLLEVSLPHGGRRHQIRAALSNAGTPICDDVKYGSSKTTGVVPFIGLQVAVLLTHVALLIFGAAILKAYSWEAWIGGAVFFSGAGWYASRLWLRQASQRLAQSLLVNAVPVMLRRMARLGLPTVYASTQTEG